ncbi:MAG TPA: ABC transporter permease subunit [bacterium]|nr:ABC transporter permease subunit [bacterium]
MAHLPPHLTAMLAHRRSQLAGWWAQRVRRRVAPWWAMRQPRLHTVLAIFGKEILETRRDRRTIVVALLLPVVMMPVVTLGIPYLSQRQQRERANTPALVAVVNRSAAASFVSMGVRKKLIRVTEVKNPRQALREGRVDAVLEVPADFQARIARGMVTVTIFYDESEVASIVARQRLTELVGSYSVLVTEGRLRARGLSRRDLAPIEVRERNVADERRLGGVLLAGLLPFFISVWAVLGGQHAALDLGAGEKERRTLEALLVSPPTRWQLSTGKFLAVTAASLAAVMMVIFTTLVTLRLGASWGLAELKRTAVAISLGPAVLLILVAILLVAFLSALQLALSFYARGVREAQQYFTPVYLLLSLPAMAAPFLEGWEGAWATYLVPGLNAVFVFRELLLGNLSWAALALTVISTTVYTAVALASAVWLLGRESVALQS